MWVWSQSKKSIIKVDSLFSVRGNDISTWVGRDLIELAIYKSTKEVDKVLKSFWDSLANRSTMFHFPVGEVSEDFNYLDAKSIKAPKPPLPPKMTTI